MQNHFAQTRKFIKGLYQIHIETAAEREWEVVIRCVICSFFGRHHDLVDRYGISVSQMTTDIFNLSQPFPGPFLIHGLSPGLQRRVPLVVQELLSLPDDLNSPPDVYWNSCYLIFSFMYMLYRLLFVLLYILCWPWCCLFFYDMRILNIPFGIFKLFLHLILLFSNWVFDLYYFGS